MRITIGLAMFGSLHFMFSASQSAAKSMPTWRLSTLGVLGAAFLGGEDLDGLVRPSRPRR